MIHSEPKIDINTYKKTAKLITSQFFLLVQSPSHVSILALEKNLSETPKNKLHSFSNQKFQTHNSQTRNSSTT